MSTFSPVIPPKKAEHWVYEAFRSISAQIGQHALDLAAVGRGEAPDGSGNALIDTTGFFFLPGRPSGQIGYGGTGPNQDLTLSSTRDADKGFIYLGTGANARVAFDEDNDFFGIGTDTPTARLHLNLATAGTSGNATFGTHFMDATVGQTGYIFSSAAYQNGVGTDWAFVIGGTNPGSGIGSVLFMNQARTLAWRLAMGTYGGDTISYVHHQHGALDTSAPYGTVNNNALFLGFNDNCGLYETHHFRHFNVWAEGDNLAGSPLSGRTVTNTNMAIVGFNSPTTQRTGTTNYDDQPVMTIGGGSWFQTYYGVALRITSGGTFAGSGGTEGAQAKQEVFQIREGGSLNSGSNMMFAVDQFGRVCLYNPGNGAMTSRLSGRRSTLLIEDGTTGSSTPSCAFELASTNAWLDGGTAVAAYQMRIGYDDVQTSQPVRNVIVGGTVRVASSEASLLNRYAVRTSAFYVTDGTFTYNSGQVGAPLGMMNILNFINNATILLALQRKSGQSGDMMRNFDSDGSTALSGFNSAGAYYLKAGAAVGYLLTSDVNGVGSWASPASVMAAPHAFRSTSSDITLATTDEYVEVDASGGNRIITLPTAVGVAGKVYTIKKMDSSTNTMTLATTSSQTIDGDTTQVTDMQFTAIKVVSNGSNWLIV